MSHEVSFDEKRDVLYVSIAGEITLKDYQEISRQIMSFPEGERVGIPIDISELKMPRWDRKTRRELAESTPVLSNTRVALTGAPPAVRIIAKVFIYVAEKTAKAKSVTPQKTRFCKTEAEAIRWLRGDLN